MKKSVKLLSALLALCFVMNLTACAGKPAEEPAPVSDSQPAPVEDVVDDQAAADHVAELIDAIYVREHTDKTL